MIDPDRRTRRTAGHLPQLGEIAEAVLSREAFEGVINTDHIAFAKDATAARGGQRSTITFQSGAVETLGVGMGVLEQACGVVVPAQPGFTLLRALLPSSDEVGVLYEEETVIAFRIDHSGSQDGPMPITVSGEPSTFSGTRWTVRQPNGRCFGPDAAHDTAEEFKAECEHVARKISAQGSDAR